VAGREAEPVDGTPLLKRQDAIAMFDRRRRSGRRGYLLRTGALLGFSGSSAGLPVLMFSECH
jgi:hypothetical protein